MLPSDSVNCWGMQIAPRTRKNGPPETRDELSVNMPPSDMKENNVCSKAVGGDYAGATGRFESGLRGR